MDQLTPRLCADTGARLAEGPAWDAEHQRLSFVDILSGRVHVVDADGRPLATYEIGGHVGAALPAAGGGWLVVDQDGFSRLAEDGEPRRLLAVQADQPDLRFNDAKCDPSGRCLAGTMRYDNQPGDGTLYRLDPGPAAVGILTARGLCNGLGWRPDGEVLYFIDSLAYCLDAHPWDVSTGAPGPASTLVRFDPDDGLPDGLCVDDEGGIWVAFYGGGCVRRYRSDGSLAAVVAMPVPEPTSLAFGGPDRNRLFITTAGGSGSPPDPDDVNPPSGAGGLWVLEPGVSGPPATPWQPVGFPVAAAIAQIGES